MNSLRRCCMLFRTPKRYLETEIVDGVRVGMFVTPGDLWQSRFAVPVGHEPGVCRWLAENLRPDDVFFDVGALFGYFCVLARALRPTVAVHAFEMSWYAAYFLRCNASEDWVVNEFEVAGVDAPGKETLDTYCARTGVVPTIIKMDVDGGEVDAMRGMPQLIAGRHTTWLIEVHAALLADRGQSVEDLLRLFPNDHEVHYLVDHRSPDGHWTPDAGDVAGEDEYFIRIGPVR